MTIYVDDLREWPGKRSQWCHMATDGDLAALHDLATRIGVRRYFQNHSVHPHYDLVPSKRRMAVALGAVEVDSKELVKRCSRIDPRPSIC